MADWSLETLLHGLHDDIHQQLETARKSFNHPGTKGDASETIWLELLQKYLPERYRAEKAHVVDSKGNFSDQIDVVVFDRQYSPFIFNFKGQYIIPAESVYAIFEAKQTINAQYVKYAAEKLKTVRDLHRTSLPIPHAGGTYPAKPPIKIIGGILTFESDWTPGMGEALKNSLISELNVLDLGCVAAHGYFSLNAANHEYDFVLAGKPATAFLFKLISQLQFSGTVPMIDVLEYSKWLTPA
ncbi:hypothetical protein SAMN05428975_5135 [Mucilaginibacter sp. OK268]|jgi:hypothetical protein|uniref:DUF6602 domain-containing protein n=1 Tax=Mucilaginibacter sp. OK268 TaxID=1881048 RepID=UPI00088B8214|nr:DUF6602 domain-containing protein [Mucilaginibacter sp. OK268]SDP99729.1 hypothetical protein SAMN05428975_5135 [Mucilaginibacter sp. OK268]